MAVSRRVHEKKKRRIFVQYREVRFQILEADGQSLSSKNGCGQNCRVLEGETTGEAEWNNTNEADGIAGRTNHDGSLGTGIDSIRDQSRQKG